MTRGRYRGTSTGWCTSGACPPAPARAPARPGGGDAPRDAAPAAPPARSCNPATLKRDIEWLVTGDAATHKVERFAMFDQFPYTDHAEAGVLLVRK